MSHNPFSISYDHSNPLHLTVARWRQISARPWQVCVRGYALAYGEALALRANGSVVRYWREDGKVRQRTYTTVHFSHSQEPTI